jgi:hypothetical protein
VMPGGQLPFPFAAGDTAAGVTVHALAVLASHPG